jgi:hypothetical protein
MGWTWGVPLHGDPLFFQQTAAQIAHGNGYVVRFLNKGPIVPTAEHPPAFSLLLATLDFVHIQSIDAHRIALAVISAGGVLAMGLFGRRLAGPSIGLVAAGLAALDPLWVQWSGLLMSESIYLVIIPTMLLFALRCIDRPNWWDFAVLGLLIAIATLIRSDAAGFVVLLGVPVLAFSAGRWKERLVFGMALLAGVVFLISPWLVRNDLRMGALTLSTNGGDTLSGSYCPATFSPKSPDYGGFSQDCQLGEAAVFIDFGRPPNDASHWTELTLADALGRTGTTYARKHLADLPGVVLAREGRVWGVYAPGTQLAFDVAEEDSGARGPKQVGQIMNWLLLPLALVGAYQLARRSRRRLIIVAVPLLVVAINAAVFYGGTRLRVAAEPTIVVLASVGAVWAIERISHAPSAEPNL